MNPKRLRNRRRRPPLRPVGYVPLTMAPPQVDVAKPVNIYTDQQYQYGPLPKGEIGDVTVYIHETDDNMFANRWRSADSGLYQHNSKTFWKDTDTPNEASYWAWQAAQ